MITFRFDDIDILIADKYRYLFSRGVTPRTRHREVQGSNPVGCFCLFFVSFIYFFICLFVWKCDGLFVGMLVVFFFYGNSN